MKIFEPHGHMYARTTQDYEAMARAGIEVLVEPAFWLGETRKYAGSFFDYFDHLYNYEHQRAGRYGIKQYVTLAMNPKESNNRQLAEEVVKELPRFLDRERVLGVGEIGFDAINEVEEDFFVRQAKMARDFKLPLLIHSPHLNKAEGIRRLIQVLEGLSYDMDLVLMDHNIEETTPMSLAAGCWAGHTVYPVTKLSPERMANIIEANGWDRMMVNSAADWGPSDPLMIVHTLHELKSRGHKDKDLRKLAWDNPWTFFKKSGRLK
jgi:predicted metal-dependent TIM-barrel fold hydrolase